MADDSALAREVTSLLASLPRTHLLEIYRSAALGAVSAAQQRFLGPQTLESALSSLFPELSAGQISAAASEAALCTIRNNCRDHLFSSPDEFRVQTRCATPEAAQALRDRTGPAILAFWHLGASHALALGLQKIQVPALIFARAAPLPSLRRLVSSEIRWVVTHTNDPNQAVLVLKQGFDQLRKGGVVVVAADGSQGRQDVPISFLGRKIALSRGLAVLARLTGAPIIPCAVTWGQKDWNFDFHLFDSLSLPPVDSLKPEAWEREVVTIAARRFEEISRAFPGQFRLENLHFFAQNTLRLAK